MKALAGLALAIVVVVGIGKVLALAAAVGAIVEAVTAGRRPSPRPLSRHAWDVHLPVHQPVH